MLCSKPQNGLSIGFRPQFDLIDVGTYNPINDDEGDEENPRSMGDHDDEEEDFLYEEGATGIPDWEGNPYTPPESILEYPMQWLMDYMP